MPAANETVFRPELIFALVGGSGARLEELEKELKVELKAYNYDASDIRLSKLLDNFMERSDQQGTSESDRIRHLQQMGDALRRRLGDGAALARAALAEIRVNRFVASGSPDSPASGHAYILHQLKHPDEVDLLRRVYGSSFLLIAGHAPREQRVNELAKRMATKAGQSGKGRLFEPEASNVINIDEKEEGDVFGQSQRDTYPKADFFANVGESYGGSQVGRLVRLLFGHPLTSPNPDEYAMYLASAVALRSSDDNRQVGAVIVNLTRRQGANIKNADVIAVGMNEVPCGGGGFYWGDESPDNRDQKLLERGDDRAAEIKIGVLAELIERLVKEEGLRDQIGTRQPSDLARDLVKNHSLKGTQFMEIGEFSRPVHAEMAALIDAARRGVAVEGHSMYVTTFPCHNCAKHIIAAGIRRVVYLEPYPKSRALDLHGEEIFSELTARSPYKEQVEFFAFSGVAPRQYSQLFSMGERGAKRGNSLQKWDAQKGSLSPLYVHPNAPLAYLAAERQELEKLPLEVYRWDKNKVCP